MLDIEEVKRRIQTARDLEDDELDLSGSCLQDLSLLTQLDEVIKLTLNDSIDLTDLSGLANLPNLNSIHLNGCGKVVDLSPLTHCRLSEISLRGCTSVRDLSPLSMLIGLHELDLTGCENVTDLSPIRDIEQLWTLNLSGCHSVRDFSPLRQMKCRNFWDLTLRDLPHIQTEIAFAQIYRHDDFSVRDESITTLPSEFAQLAWLKKVNLAGCSLLRDITELANLPQLCELRLDYCRFLTVLAPLANLSNLQSLSLNHCVSLFDVSPLAGLKSLRLLDLEGCSNLSDLSSLKVLTELTQLNLRACPKVVDLSPLKNLKSAHITCDAVSVSSAERWEELRVAESRDLKTKLLEVCQNIVVKEHDCGTYNGFFFVSFDRNEDDDRDLQSMILGHATTQRIVNPMTDEIVVAENEIISADSAQKIADLGFRSLAVRSPLLCDSVDGVCRLCYGIDSDTDLLVEVGTKVGITAAEAIGDVECQLKSRMDAGSISGLSNHPIDHQRPATDKQPSVGRNLLNPGDCLRELFELFEAKSPDHAAILAETDGQVEIREKLMFDQSEFEIYITNDWSPRNVRIPPGTQLCVKANDQVRAGDPLTTGKINPHDVLNILGVEACLHLLLRSMHKTFKAQGIVVDNKHTEIILAQMLRYVQIVQPEDTGLAREAVLDRFELSKINRELWGCLRVTDKGDSDFCEGEVVPFESIEESIWMIQDSGGNPCKTTKPRPALAQTRLLGISEAALCNRKRET